MSIKLSILVATVPSRIRLFFPRIMDELTKQAECHPYVEVLGLFDNKRRTIGEKRQALLDTSRGEYVAFVDDDDRIAPTYITDIVQAIHKNPGADCINFDHFIDIDGHTRYICKYSKDYTQRARGDDGIWRGLSSHTQVWAAHIAKKHVYSARNNGEDYDWVDRAIRDVRNEVQINKVLYFYDAKYTTTSEASGLPNETVEHYVTTMLSSRASHKRPFLSIVMGYYNRKEQCLLTLDSLELSSFKEGIEVIVVDDGSEDFHSLEDSIHAYTFAIRLIKVPRSVKTWRNPVVAYNIGIYHAVGEWVILQNPEVCHVGDICAHVSTLNKENYYAFTVIALAEEGYNSDVKRHGFKPSVLNTGIPVMFFQHPVYRPRALHFCTAVHRSKLDGVGGFNDAMMNGVDYDDDEFLTRIQRVCKETIHLEVPIAIHLWHPKMAYDGDPSEITKLRAENKRIHEDTCRNTSFVHIDIAPTVERLLTHLQYHVNSMVAMQYSTERTSP
jgi:glycosyltransferase involved in cell wall biosynthesis